VPVTVERKTRNGWREVGNTFTNGNGTYKVKTDGPGKYRAVAPEIGIGTPTLTTCLRDSVTDTFH